MSIFSDYAVGALSDEEFESEGVRMNNEDRSIRDIYSCDYFHYRCPYTDLHCETFDCENCEVEMSEREYAKELDADEEDEGVEEVVEEDEVDPEWDREAEEDFKRACERDEVYHEEHRFSGLLEDDA